MTDETEPKNFTEYRLVMTREEYTVFQRIMIMQRSKSTEHLHDYVRARNLERAVLTQEVIDFTLNYETKVTKL